MYPRRHLFRCRKLDELVLWSEPAGLLFFIIFLLWYLHVLPEILPEASDFKPLATNCWIRLRVNKAVLVQRQPHRFIWPCRSTNFSPALLPTRTDCPFGVFIYGPQYPVSLSYKVSWDGSPSWVWHTRCSTSRGEAELGFHAELQNQF